MPVKIKFLLVVFAALPLAGLLAQDSLSAPAEYACITYWSKNDTLEYEVVKGKMRYEDEKLVDSTGRTSRIKLVVIDSTAAGYTIEVGFDGSDFDLEGMGISAKELAMFAHLFKNFRVQYEISETGVFLGFKNIEQMQKMYRVIFEMILKDKASTPEQKQLLENLKNMMSSKSYVESKAFEEVRMLHMFHGQMYQLDTLITAQGSMPNAFNPDQPISCTIEFEGRIDPEDEDFVYFFHETVADEEATSNMVRQTFKQMGVGDDVQTQMKDAKFSLHDSNTFLIHMGSGTVSSYYRERRTSVSGEGFEKVEFIEVNLK